MPKLRKLKKFEQHFESTLTAAIATALGFTIALFWRDAIMAMIDQFVLVQQLSGSGFVYKLATAVIVTIICSIGLWILSKPFNRSLGWL